jgi:hypothetical protein
MSDRLQEYVERFRAEINTRSLEEGTTAFREEVFTAATIKVLEDMGQVAGGELAFLDRKFGRSVARMNASWVDEDSREVDLFITIYRGHPTIDKVPASEITTAIGRAIRAYQAAVEGRHSELEPASAAYDAMQRIHEFAPQVTRLRIIVLVDGIAAEGYVTPDQPGVETQVDVWDLQRVCRADTSGLPYEPIPIDISEKWGTGLPCLRMPKTDADYTSYLVIFPGELLKDLYHEHGPRLLELNVRSFLQARGKVNKGIRDTLRHEPHRFMAYNNGISATAERVQLEAGVDGGLSITSVVGLQIVNGGQTVASIHRAATQDRVDLRQVYVQAKLTIVQQQHIETLVPLVSRYANTQNRVNEADFSANHAFHVALQKLAETVWAPGERSRWFYERARGQYQVARIRHGTTPAKTKAFDQTTPPKQRFDKVDLAKYLNSWDLLPHLVCRGGQKNFVAFMDRLAREGTKEPDAQYYRDAIAKGIIYKAAERAARGLTSYRSQTVAYTVSLLSFRAAGRLDLTTVWDSQEPSAAMISTIAAWLPQVHEQLVLTAKGQNVTEWCKKEDCWRAIRALTPPFDQELPSEFAHVAATHAAEEELTSADHENIARVMQLRPEQWLRIVAWGGESGALKEWQIGIASSLAGYAAANWYRTPTPKQALQAVKILQVAEDEGAWTQEED